MRIEMIERRRTCLFRAYCCYEHFEHCAVAVDRCRVKIQTLTEYAGV